MGDIAAEISRAPRLRPEETSRVPTFVGLGVFMGTLVFGAVNMLARRPVSYQPWWLVFNAGAGGYLMHHLATKYDATTDFMAQQLGAFAKMPTWMYAQLSQEELDSELRAARTAEFRAAFTALAEAEEAEFLAAAEGAGVALAKRKAPVKPLQ